MTKKGRRGDSGIALPPDAQPPTMSITISLQDIYASLCPKCQEGFLALLASKASGGMLRASLRQQLDPSCHSERSEESLSTPS